jgi:hypothetical protein
LHQNALKTALNLHPAEGIHPHEDVTHKWQPAMGIDPASKTPVPSYITSETFRKAYFEILHHPLEAQGVDFWWIDWQQGTRCKITWLRPAFYVEPFALLLIWVERQKKPLYFLSLAWGLVGSVTPLVFRGIRLSHGKSLAFQPEFTAYGCKRRLWLVGA